MTNTLSGSLGPSKSQQAGFGLLELMIAMTIGLFMLGGVLATYAGSKQSYRQNDAMGRLQENARFAFQFISRDLRQAGIPGCSGSDASVPLKNNLNPYANDGISVDKAASFAWGFDRSAIEGFEATGTNTWSSVTMGTPSVALTGSDVAPSAVSGTDVILVRGPDSIQVVISGQPAGNESGATCVDASCTVSAGNTCHTTDLLIKSEPSVASPRIKVGDTVVATTCASKVAFKVTGYDGSTGVVKHVASGAGTGALRNVRDDLGGCLVGGDLAVMSAKSYFVRDNPAGVRALYRATVGVDATGSPQINPNELVEGVQDMQITYGEDTDGDVLADVFVTADSVANWSNVVSARVSLLMRSVEDNVVTKPQVYVYNGQPAATAADRRLYQVFTTTIALRGRVL